MRIIIYISTLILTVSYSFGQTNNQPTSSGSILAQNDISQIFTDSVRNKFNIDFTIFRAYTYSDKSGKYVIALTEKIDSITPAKDTLHYKIKAFNFRSTAGGLEKQWEVNDFTINQANDNGKENSIWFWTKYTEFNDIDNDGLVDPILVYGTSGTNGYDDGRIKILCFYKGQKNVIRHQNGVLDFERNTQVDQIFYSLPSIIQNHIISLMQKIADDNLAIFPYGWQNAMKNKELKFDERH